MNNNSTQSFYWALLFLVLPLLNSAQHFEFLDTRAICPEEIGWSSMALGDIDGDGDMDLVTDSYRYPAYFLNDGNGSFSDRTEIFIADYPYQERGDLSLVDMDGDTDLDLVMSTGGLYADVIWLANDGAAVFSAPQLINTDDTRVRDYQVVDLDMDGDQDLLMSLGWITTGGEKVVWYVNNGAGVFGSQQVIRLGANSLVRAVDIDDDGDMDVIRYHASDDITWLANDGAMGFTNESASTATSATVRMIQVADMDQDDDMDLILSQSDYGIVEWYANDGSGGFEFGDDIEETGPVTHIELVDIDSDNDIDILVNESETLALFSNDGTGQLSYDEYLSTESESGYFFIAGDVDGDGDPDVIDSHFNDPVYLHRFEDGSPVERTALSSFILEPTWCHAADMDGDGDLDAVSTTSIGDEVSWYANPGTDEDIPWTRFLITTEFPSPNRIIPGDLDDDGDQDLVISSSASGQGLAILVQEAAGTWTMSTFPAPPSGSISALHLEDIDGDADLDILYSTANIQTISLMKNQGGGSFQPAIDLVSLELFANSIETPDLNGDGLKDLLLASRFGDEVVWFQNLGTESFGVKQVIYQDAGTLFHAHASDLDADGDLDVISTDAFYDEILYFKNDGAGDFGPPQMVGTANGVRMTVTEDMDGDGDLDIVFGGSFGGVYYNDGDGQFNELDGIYPSNASLFSEVVHPFDMDGDGDLDVLKAMSSSDRIDYAINHLGEGCMDPAACNYDPDAVYSSGNCCYEDCGCTDVNAENYDPNATCDDGSCQYILGCTDPLAENFDPAATSDDGSCVFIYGCADAFANNYDPNATIDDGSCLFDVIGHVYHDLNENGIEEPGEYGLAGQEVYLLPDSILGFTDEEGVFSFNDLDYGFYSVGVNNDTVFPFNTTLNEIEFSLYLGDETELAYGISDEAPLAQVQVFSIPFSNSLPCGETYIYRAAFRNLGNFSFDGTVAYTYDSLYTGFAPVTPVDSVDQFTIYTSFDNLLPGELRVHEYQFNTPSVDFLGDTFSREVIMWATQLSDTMAYGQWVEDHILNCSYDPNDKQVAPSGYTAEHYVHSDSLLHYQIRFQNTGTAPAIDVTITDSLDDALDLSAFQFLDSSHPTVTTLDPESRELQFYFPDIMLPDSASDQLGSQGHVTFSIRASSNTSLLTEINNTAQIYFDNNPPIVTNTTWSTLYDCSLFEVSFNDNAALLTASDGDNYQWYLDGESIEGATDQEYEAMVTGDYSVIVGIDFPCSETSSSTFIVVSSIDELADSPMALFPNPMTTSAILDVGELRGEVQIEIYDISGKLMRSESVNPDSGILNIQRGELASGSYLLRVISEGNALELPFMAE